MSAIGGAVMAEGRSLPMDRLMDMSNGMILRGKRQRGAYLLRDRGIFHNSSEIYGVRQPYTLSKNGRNYTSALDGYLEGTGDLEGIGASFGAASSAELALDCYVAFGTEFARYLKGEFSVAIFDEYRNEVILARDKKGKKPIFFINDRDCFAFASEIKGIMKLWGEAQRIDTSRLRAHIFSPCGMYNAEDIYIDIHSIPCGNCAVYSRLGLNIFPYENDEIDEEDNKSVPSVPVDFFCPEGEELKKILTESLFAFDYPEFDHLMAGFIRTVEREIKEKKKHNICLSDTTPCIDIKYAQQRADRIGAIKGVEVKIEADERRFVRDKELRKMEKHLQSLFSDEDERTLDTIVGEGWKEILIKEKSTAKRVRSLGMLYQTLIWKGNYNLIFV